MTLPTIDWRRRSEALQKLDPSQSTAVNIGYPETSGLRIPIKPTLGRVIG